MRRELRRQRKGLHRLFFFLVLLPMLLVFPYLRALNNPNEYVRVFTVMSLVESGTYRIDEQVQTFGWVNDMAKTKGRDDGVDHYYMVKGPGAVYVGIPGYFLFSKVVAPALGKKYPGVFGGHPTAEDKPAGLVPATQEERLWWLKMGTWAMRIFGTQIPCFLFLVWFERYLRSFTQDPAIRYAAVAAAGLGTNFLAYVHMFASHSIYAAIAFLAFATIESELRKSQGDPKRIRISRALFAGFCTSACVALEYQALFLTLVLTLFATLSFWSPLRALFWLIGAIPGLRGARRLVPLGASVNPTRILAFGVGGLLNIPHVMYFHWAAYNNPFTPGHQKLETARFASEHQMGLWGILWPTWDHIKALAIDPGFGFFGMSPFMWIGLIGAPLILFGPRTGTGLIGTGGASPASYRTHMRVITLVCLAGMAVVIGVNAGFVEWRAGWTVGPRYLVVCAPFFAFLGAITLERMAQGSRAKRAIARGVGGGLALAGVVTIGTVGLLIDTLPETIARPFAQFSIPMARVGLVPHHVGEWFGWDSTTLWYVACGAMLLAPIVAGLVWHRGEQRGEIATRTIMFVAAFALGMVPAFSPPEDSTQLFVLHPSTIPIGTGWEPPGRDRLTKLREQAERYGSRGPGPCIWYRIADLERVLNQIPQASRDEARAKGASKETCPKSRF
jgi:hypothetical protein